jgi:hypothetical protein
LRNGKVRLRAGLELAPQVPESITLLTGVLISEVCIGSERSVDELL